MLFLASDTHLITTGSRDFCILQWTVEGNLPAFNEEEEYEMESRHQNQNRQRLSDNDSHRHSDYSVDDRDEDSYKENTTRGRQARARQRPSENTRYSDATSSMTLKIPQGRGRPLRKSYQHNSSGDERGITERSPQRNGLPQNASRSQQGSYAERFNKQKAVNGNDKWNSQQDPEDMDQYSDDESPRQHEGLRGRGKGRGAERSRFPARGQDKRWDRRQMR